MAEAKKLNYVNQTRLEPRAMVSSNGHYPDYFVARALELWEAEKSKPEISAQLAGIRKRRLLEQTRLEIEGKGFRVKCYNYRGRVKSLLENLVYHSEAMRNFQIMEFLTAQGVAVPKPLLLLERGPAGVPLESVLVMEDLGPGKSYKQILAELEADPAERERFLQQIFLALARFNKTGIYTLDADKNLLVKKQNRDYRIYFFDFDNVFAFRKNNPRRAGRALAFLLRTRKLHQKLEDQRVLELVGLYLNEIGKPDWRDAVLSEISRRLSRTFATSARA